MVVMNYFGCGISDKGIKRSVNQDSIWLQISETNNKGQIALAVVCDGIGGLEQGEVASSTAIEAFSDWYSNTLPEIISDLSDGSLQVEWMRLISDINARLMQYGKEQGIRLGTTMTAMFIFGGRYMIAQVGDSRAYCINDEVTQITEDHTFYTRELKAGRMNRNQLLLDPRKNRITRGVGIADTVQPDFYFGTVGPEECVWMLCSDGLRHKITNDEFRDAIRPENINDCHELQTICEHLVNEVKERGEKDNISVILIKASNK